jgi:prevent-host-death family protein
MRRVRVHEAKTTLSALLQAVAQGEEVVITNRNVPVARLVPFEQRRQRPVFGSARAAMARAGLTDAAIARVLAPMGEEELAAWGLARAAGSPTLRPPTLRSSTTACRSAGRAEDRTGAHAKSQHEKA